MIYLPTQKCLLGLCPTCKGRPRAVVGQPTPVSATAFIIQIDYTDIEKNKCVNISVLCTVLT